MIRADRYSRIYDILAVKLNMWSIFASQKRPQGVSSQKKKQDFSFVSFPTVVECARRHIFRFAKNITAGCRLKKSKMNFGFSFGSYCVRTLRVLALA